MEGRKALDENAKKCWARTVIRVRPESYWLVSLPHGSIRQAASVVSESKRHFAAFVLEEDEVSLTVEEKLWNARSHSIPHHASEGPYRAITFQLNVDLGVCGYFAPAADRLAEAGIPIVPQCAYSKDHVLVRAADADRAAEILNRLVRECSENR